MAALEPLANGTVLADRFEIESVLGSGGFSIVYVGLDRQRGDRVVIKELAPKDARRETSCTIDLGGESHRLRRKFLDEGALQSRLKINGLVPVRSWFSENGTAYVISDFLPDARPLDAILKERRLLPPDEALVLFYSLLEIVEAVHSRGVLHRDIKPSNILVGPGDRVWLIDFGAAREWQLDAHTQTVLFTPGFAPPEQLSEKARRGPATDIYALCGTLYQMLTGDPPPPVAERAAGAELNLDRITDVAGSRVANGIAAGLALKMVDRPQSIQELRETLESTDSFADPRTLEEIGDALYRARHLTFGKRECPSCHGVLSEPKPLGKNVCPVCHAAVIQHREIHLKLCPNCRSGVLHRHENLDPPYICPWCQLGVMRYRRERLLGTARKGECSACGMTARSEPGDFTILSTGKGEQKPPNRADSLWVCDGCQAQFDEQSDSRWLQVVPPPGRFTTLYPDEWARVAAGLDPGAGNAECSECGAEYFTDGQSMTLLSAHHDPHGFAEDFQGRRIPIEEARWLGVGKMSPHRGFVCEDCGTEFDFASSCLLLVHSKNRKLSPFVEECHGLETWHRLAQGLPGPDREHDLEDEIPVALVAAYEKGMTGFDGRSELAWKGNARRIDTDQEGTLVIEGNEIAFGGLLRKWRVSLEDVFHCDSDEDCLQLVVRGETEPVAFEIDPVELSVHLKSGTYTGTLTATNLSRRLASHVPATSA